MGLLVPLTEISFIWIHSLHGLLVPSMQLLSVWIHSLHGPLVPPTAISYRLNLFTPRTSGAFHGNIFTSDQFPPRTSHRAPSTVISFHLNSFTSWTYRIFYSNFSLSESFLPRTSYSVPINFSYYSVWDWTQGLLQFWHCQSDALTTQLELIRYQLGLIHPRLDQNYLPSIFHICRRENNLILLKLVIKSVSLKGTTQKYTWF